MNALMYKKISGFLILGLSVLLFGCGENNSTPNAINSEGTSTLPATLSDADVENIVRRSYQYVAMYNVNNKTAMDPANPASSGGWNKTKASLHLFDHNVKVIARPNNDTLYSVSSLDLTREPMILEAPAFDSKYASLMATGYDHYVNIPLSSGKNEFAKPTRILFYSERTPAFDMESLTGIDKVEEMTGDYISAVYRVMPHMNEPERLDRIRAAMQQVKIISLSEYRSGEKQLSPEATDNVAFPAFGKTNEDVFENNLLEVMQFVFNHTTFDSNNEMDNALLAAYQPLGVVPGRDFEIDQVATIDGQRFRQAAEALKQQTLAKMVDREYVDSLVLKVFQPKGQIDLDTQILQSVVGPIGQPAQEAVYPQPIMADGKPMTALNDYVLHINKEDMPPANAFWSFTLYDKENGFFIPNDRKKYSVGENGGMSLNEDGGISIYIAAEKPEGVPEENWLPINRGDYGIDLGIRLYSPDLERFKTWPTPQLQAIQ